MRLTVIGTCRAAHALGFQGTEKEKIMRNRTLAAVAIVSALTFSTAALADETGLVGGAIAGAVVGGPVGAVVGGVTGNYITNHHYYHRHYYHHYSQRGDRRYVR